MSTPPRLILVPTPVGNLGDLTVRALEVLKVADAIAVEDSRRTSKLLAHYGISKPLILCHRHNEREAADKIVQRVAAGETIAVVTDGGTPGLSDPGAAVVRAAIGAAVSFTVLPGATAAVPALVLSGLPADRFTFLGFLPRKGQERAAALARIRDAEETVIIYESPERIERTVAELGKLFPGRPAAAVRELSKLHEETVRFTLGDAVAVRAQGEFVLVIGGKPAAQAVTTDLSPEEQLAELVRLGASRKEALKTVAARLGVAKSDLYRDLEKQKQGNHG